MPRQCRIVSLSLLVCLAVIFTSAQRAKPPAGNPAIAVEATKAPFGIDLMVMDADARNQVRIVSGGRNLTPAWSPDGAWIAFARNDIASPGIFIVRPTGSGLCRVVTTSGVFPFAAPAWTPTPHADGRHRLVYADQDPTDTAPDLYAVSALCNATDRHQLTSTPGIFEGWPAWSVDGRLAAVVDPDIHVFDATFDTSGAITLDAIANLTSVGPLATGFVFGPSWTADGTELLVSALGELWIISGSTPGIATPITDSPSFVESRATWAPDFRSIAFAEAGALYTMDVSQPWTIGTPELLTSLKRTGLRHPSWRPF